MPDVSWYLTLQSLRVYKMLSCTLRWACFISMLSGALCMVEMWELYLQTLQVLVIEAHQSGQKKHKHKLSSGHSQSWSAIVWCEGRQLVMLNSHFVLFVKIVSSLPWKLAWASLSVNSSFLGCTSRWLLAEWFNCLWSNPQSCLNICSSV